MTNQLGDAPTERDAFDEDTKEIVVPPSTLKINVGWRLRLAQAARRLFSREKKS